MSRVRNITLFYQIQIVQLVHTSFASGLISNAESQALYIETGQRTQKWMKAVHFICVIMGPALYALPPLIASYFIYFTTDMGDEAFKLPTPMW